MFTLDLHSDSRHFFGGLDLSCQKNSASWPDGEVFSFSMYDKLN